MKPSWKNHTPASCFASFVLPYVLFVNDFQARMNTVLGCCLAWNIASSPGTGDRERHIDCIWGMVEADDKKRDLFPWLLADIPKASLRPSDGSDDIALATTHPGLFTLSTLTKSLTIIKGETKRQLGLLGRAKRHPVIAGGNARNQMATAYCLQRADLLVYHKVLTVWLETKPALEVQGDRPLAGKA